MNKKSAAFYRKLAEEAYYSRKQYGAEHLKDGISADELEDLETKYGPFGEDDILEIEDWFFEILR